MLRTVILTLAIAGLAACGSTPSPSQEFPSERWQYATGEDERYLLAPGDEVEIVVHSAPELSRTLQIAPDGRLRMPLAAPIIASARTVEEVQTALMVALGTELKDPDLDVVPVSFSSQRIFIGGEVGNPSMYDLPGQIDPIQAIVMAGGFTNDARQRQVLVMRRLPGGEVRTVVFDVKAGIFDPEMAAFLPLRRFDVVYVPRTRIANQNQFIQQYVRNALPIEFSVFYDLAGERR